jgi:hypothetical protein
VCDLLFPRSTDLLAKNGFLETSNFDLSKSTIELQGEWNFFWNELLSPNQEQTEKSKQRR